MDEERFLDQSIWLEICQALPGIDSDLDGVKHLVERFTAQYLPALFKSKSQADADRVWLAFWHYLVAPRTNRKPFGLSSRPADLLIAEFQKALIEPGPIDSDRAD
jgi:hypothetical protein